MGDLLKAGADVNIPYPEGDSPLLRLITDVQKSRFKWSDFKNIFSILELLVRHGANIEAVISSGHSAKVADCLRTNDAAVYCVIHEVFASRFFNLGNERCNDEAENLPTIFHYFINISRTWTELQNYVIPLTRCLLCVILKPSSKSQFMLALENKFKTLLNIFIKTGAMPKLLNIPELEYKYNLGLVHSLPDVDNLMLKCDDMTFSCTISPFLYSLCNYDLAISRMFLNCNFLNSLDINPPRELKLGVRKRVEWNAEINQIFREFYYQPHSLTMLCFVQVSVCGI